MRTILFLIWILLHNLGGLQIVKTCSWSVHSTISETHSPIEESSPVVQNFGLQAQLSEVQVACHAPLVEASCQTVRLRIVSWPISGHFDPAVGLGASGGALASTLKPVNSASINYECSHHSHFPLISISAETPQPVFKDRFITRYWQSI